MISVLSMVNLLGKFPLIYIKSAPSGFMYFATIKSQTGWWCLQFRWFRNFASCRPWGSEYLEQAFSLWWTRLLFLPALLQSGWGLAQPRNTRRQRKPCACAALLRQVCGISAHSRFWCPPNAMPDGGAYFCFCRHRRSNRQCWFRKCLGVQTTLPSHRVLAICKCFLRKYFFHNSS